MILRTMAGTSAGLSVLYFYNRLPNDACYLVLLSILFQILDSKAKELEDGK